MDHGRLSHRPPVCRSRLRWAAEVSIVALALAIGPGWGGAQPMAGWDRAHRAAEHNRPAVGLANGSHRGLAVPGQTVPPAPGRAEPPIAVSEAHFDLAAFRRAQAQPLPATPQLVGTRVLILPHHWLAADLIVEGLSRLARSGDWRRVVLLAPDHRQRARWPAVSTARSWTTPCGPVAGDGAVVRQLAATGALALDTATVGSEHAVAGLVPALAELLPSAKLIPIVVRNDGRWPDVVRLAAALRSQLSSDAVILVSSDFSHDVLPLEARRRDEATLRVLMALDPVALRRRRELGCDAWNALAAAQLIARDLGATEFVLLRRSDGSFYPGYAGGAVTSYVLGYYALPRQGVSELP